MHARCNYQRTDRRKHVSSEWVTKMLSGIAFPGQSSAIKNKEDLHLLTYICEEPKLPMWHKEPKINNRLEQEKKPLSTYNETTLFKWNIV